MQNVAQKARFLLFKAPPLFPAFRAYSERQPVQICIILV